MIRYDDLLDLFHDDIDYFEYTSFTSGMLPALDIILVALPLVVALHPFMLFVNC